MKTSRGSLALAVGDSQISTALVKILLLSDDAKAEAATQVQALLEAKDTHDKSRDETMAAIRDLASQRKEISAQQAEIDALKSALDARQEKLNAEISTHTESVSTSSDALAENFRIAQEEINKQRALIEADRTALVADLNKLHDGRIALDNANRALDGRAEKIKSDAYDLVSRTVIFEKEKAEHQAWHDSNVDALTAARKVLGAT